MAPSEPLREMDVLLSPARLGSWTDCLAGKYSKAAEDSSTNQKAREAGALVSVVEGHMSKEEAADALKGAKDALKAFRAASDATGVSDAARLVLHALCCTGQLEEGETMAKEELAARKSAGDKSGEAKMQLSLAELKRAVGSAAALDEALASAQSALALFRAEGEKKMVASAQLELANVLLERKGDAKKRAEEAKQACDEALPVFRDLGEVKAEAYTLHVAACARALAGSNEGALRAAKEAQALFEKAGLPKQAAFELNHVAIWHLLEGDVDEAVAAAEASLDIFGDDLVPTEAEGIVMQTLVQAYMQQKEAQEALEVAKAELERFQDAGNAKGQAAAEEMVMLATFSLGSIDKAMRYAQRAADTLEEAGDKRGQGRVLRSVCALHRAKGENDRALRVTQEALTIFETLEDAREQALTLQARADVYLERKEHGRAEALAAEAKDLFREARDAEGEAQALLLVSSAQLLEGNGKQAAASAREAQDCCSESQNQEGEAQALRTLVNVHVQERDFDAALRSLGSLLGIAKELGDREEEVSSMILTCRVLLMQHVQREEDGKGNEKLFKSTADKVAKTAKDALSISRKLDSPSSLGSALFTVGQAQLMAGKIPEAMKAAEEASQIFRGGQLASGEAAALTLLADCHLFQRDLQKARSTGEEAVYLFQQAGEVEMESEAWSMLERVDKVEAEIREEQRRREEQQWQMQQQQWQMQPGQGQQFEAAPQGAEEQASAAAGGAYEAKLVKLDIGAGLDQAVLKGQILEITKGLIGFDEEIEFDAPLMESGLTSNTAVLLRDALTQQLPGVNLPVTLVFDYPSIQSMSELIVENAAKAAKKAAKKLQG